MNCNLSFVDKFCSILDLNTRNNVSLFVSQSYDSTRVVKSVQNNFRCGGVEQDTDRSRQSLRMLKLSINMYSSNLYSAPPTTGLKLDNDSRLESRNIVFFVFFCVWFRTLLSVWNYDDLG
jgi:hypothetical protein